MTGLALRQVRRGAVAVTVVAAGMSALVVATYDDVVGSAPGGAAALAALAGNPAVRTLFGDPVALDNPGGFAVWRTGTVLAVLVGVWAALATTRVLRGEEDTGRLDLLLGGVLPVAAVVRLHLAVLLGAVGVVGVATAAALVLAGAEPTGSVLHGAGMAAVGVAAIGLAGVASQVAPARAAASGLAVAVLLGGLLVRMVGDGVQALGWTRWLSPFGLVALVEPFHTDRVPPLLVLVAAGLAVVAVVPSLAGRRDVRAGLLPARPPRRARTALLSSPARFAVRQVLAPLAGWAAGIGAFFLLIGSVSRSMTDFLDANPVFADLAGQAGFAELGSVQGYAATLFALLAVPAGAFAAVRTGALGSAETGRRLDLLLAGPVTRTRLLAGHVAVTAAAAVVLTVVAGVALWVGAAAVGSPLGFGESLAGALNTLPVTALGLGAAVAALGLAPGAVVPIGLLPGAGGFLLTVVADSVGAPPWVVGVSPFAHLAAVPAVGPDLGGAAVMTVVAAALVVAGAVGYGRRDVR
ncbi:polyketide antibiotic transporter [Pseudonocardia sp. KRD-184]|uniref:Polyketide antibiotic transporter n=1 Tax=Pseudonocardia oceani TaxID=2792013 RepID=A0ABS6UGG8_9PSEU|nr:polyketide antibiotic transporter [Pseudonocardia oceani]MBW0094173.1 polyketide antibiotic transporter [Pseudonocardia oceani]MBW0095910.1 polyketide antibiotic transporter [Pseudonocardia oceani]MBW0122713.1 polyketide antibiotic transporter [Pseudonocardia oceani]MBW0131312.1 polyketide antibiotic transporter [Pseudonocardia oceani]